MLSARHHPICLTIIGALGVALSLLLWTSLSARRHLEQEARRSERLRRTYQAKAERTTQRARNSERELALWRDVYDTWHPPLFVWTQPAERRSGLDVLVVGGSPGGVAAAIAAAALGARVALTEEYPWVGGAFTTEGVSVPDEAWLDWPPPTKGVLGEFQHRVLRRYGDDLPSNTLSGWPFLPWDGAKILATMLRDAHVDVKLNARFRRALVHDGAVTGAEFQAGDRVFELAARRVVDATWNGDVAVSAGCSYRAGREARSETGELWAPEKADDLENTITYVLVVRDTGEPVTPPKRPAGYDAADYGPGVPWYAPHDSPQLSLYQYGRLPRGHVMVNWPYFGNDLEVHGYSAASPAQKQHVDREAKRRALGFWYYLKTDPAFASRTRDYDLATGFGTSDRLPLAPYHRSSRRIQCMYTLNANDIWPPVKAKEREQPRPKVFNDAVGLGDYQIDIHGIGPNRPRVPQRFFTIPYRSLVPADVDNLLMGDLAIGATFLAQGAIRLQCTRMRVGQAAGVAAAASIKLGVSPRALDPHVTQVLLTRQDLRIYPPPRS